MNFQKVKTQYESTKRSECVMDSDHLFEKKINKYNASHFHIQNKFKINPHAKNNLDLSRSIVCSSSQSKLSLESHLLQKKFGQNMSSFKEGSIEERPQPPGQISK